MATELKRLTSAILHKTESIKGSKSAAYYDLCQKGYLPSEIAIFTDSAMTSYDIVQHVRLYSERNNLPLPISCARKNRSTRPNPPEDWRAAFRSTVMRVGMHLSLTQPMLEYLCAVADDVQWDRSTICGSSRANPCNSFATAGSLEKRGLIRRKSSESIRKIVDNNHNTDRDSFYELTEAGQAVVDLLKSVGIFIEADEAIKRKTNKT